MKSKRRTGGHRNTSFYLTDAADAVLPALCDLYTQRLGSPMKRRVNVSELINTLILDAARREGIEKGGANDPDRPRHTGRQNRD